MNKFRKLLALIVVAGYGCVPLFASSFTYQLTITLAIALAGLAVAVLLRAGLISFGHALFYATGAYSVAFVSEAFHLGILGVLFISAIGGLILALPIGLFVVRYRGIFFAMLNLALSMVLYTIFMKFYQVTGGSDGISVNVTQLLAWNLNANEFGYALFYIAFTLVAIVCWCVNLYWKSPSGWALFAVHDSEIRVEYLGRSTTRVLLVAYLISGLLAGLGGGIAGLAVGHVGPHLAYWTTSASFLVVAVLGGSASFFGPLVGALIYITLSVMASQYLHNTWELVLGGIIFLVIRFASDGLWALYDRGFSKQATLEK